MRQFIFSDYYVTNQIPVTLPKMNSFRDLYRRFVKVLTYLSQYFSTSGISVVRNKSQCLPSIHVIFIFNFAIFTRDATIFTKELCFTYSKGERCIPSTKNREHIRYLTSNYKLLNGC